MEKMNYKISRSPIPHLGNLEILVGNGGSGNFIIHFHANIGQFVLKYTNKEQNYSPA